ncbi:MAG: N-acetyltransferase [Ruminococcus sp.]|nr:N-acetyltransferase [Candidatus Apopatosoma intestinale]
MTIRMATPADAGAIYQIYVPYVRDTAISFEITVPTAEEFRGRIERTLLEYPYLVAEEGGQIVGYAYASAFHGREAYRHTAETSIYVERSERRHGIGRALYAELEKACAEQNIFVLYACATTTDRADDRYLNDDSLRFHKAVGYREIGRHENCGYKFDRWYGIVWLEKKIADRPAHPEPFRPVSK